MPNEFTVNGARPMRTPGTRALLQSQPTAVFIHGAANDHSVWSLQSRYFAFHGWNVLAVDLPGPRSERRPLCTSVPALAEWMAAFLDGLR